MEGYMPISGGAAMTINADRHGDPYAGSDNKIGEDGARTPASSGDSEGASDGSAAARLLEITARETEQWRADARSEAAALVADARRESAELVEAARAEAERLVTAAQEKATQTTNEARVEAYRMREDTAATRRRHDEDIAQLEEVATEHREGLRRHLTEMLDRIEPDHGEASS
jgi:cell division septum initiation protein DivIVA